MPAQKDLDELLATAVGWEDKLTAYFDDIESAIESPSCRRIVSLLKSSHQKSCEILHEIHAEDFGANEWLSCSPENIDLGTLLMPPQNLADTSPHEMLRRILAFEEAIKEFYSCIAGRVTSRDERELFESLAQSKDRYVFEIRSCLDYEQKH